MNFIVVGTNHKFSPIELRERIFFPKKRLKDALGFLKEQGGLKSAFIISTCNRVEIYAVSDKPEAKETMVDFISRFHEIDKKRFLPYFYIYNNKDAIRHLFSVAGGLDSMVLGERQITEQVNFSFNQAKEAGFIDDLIAQAFYRAVSLVKRIHKEAGISDETSSIGSAAVDLIRRKSGSLSDKNILIIGIGKVTELLLKHLNKERPNLVLVSSKAYQRASELANSIGARAVRFDELKDVIKGTDILITATASPHIIIKKETFSKPPYCRLIIVDLALPRNVSQDVRRVENIELYCLDDIGAEIDKEKKINELNSANRIIDIEAEDLWKEFIESEQERVPLP